MYAAYAHYSVISFIFSFRFHFVAFIVPRHILHGSLMLKIYRTGKFDIDTIHSTLEDMAARHGRASLLLSDGIMLPPDGVLRNLPMDMIMVTRILTSHQLLKVLMDCESTAYCICIVSSVMDDWKLHTMDSIYDVLRIMALEKHCDIALNVVGGYSAMFSVSSGMHGPEYGTIMGAA